MEQVDGKLWKAFVPRSPSKKRVEIIDAINALMPEYEINNDKRFCAFMANCAVETAGWRVFEENLNYSATRLRQVWPRRFKTMAQAKRYARNPRKLANYVYGGRMGNKGKKDAGWKYRGRGPMQLTGYNNHAKFTKITGIDVVNNPDQLLDIYKGLKAACVYWKITGCNELADKGQLVAIRKRINGGTHGLKDMKIHYRRARKIFTGYDPIKQAAKVGTGTITTTGGGAVAVQGPDPILMYIIVGAIVAMVIGLVWKKMKNDKEDKDAVARLARTHEFKQVAFDLDTDQG